MTHTDKSLAWWQRGIVYQIYPRSFQDTNHDGIGDLQGVINRLDYLAGSPDALGVDAIWLSPFYPSPMADFGYDVADYTDVHPMFGDLATFNRLVEAAHRRGLRVIIDYVPNHTSDQHPWFLESRLSRDNPKRDWYIWSDPLPGGAPPNNWGSVFGGSAWEWDEKTGQYYLHQFLKEQPDLNWRSPEVRKSMLDVLRFWLERGVDGFRMDVVGMILKDQDLRDNPPNPDANPNMPENDLFGRLINIYNQDLDDVHEIIADFRRLLDEYSEEEDRIGIGEVWYDLPRWIKYYGEHGEGLQLPFNFRLIDVPWTAPAVRQSVADMEAALPPFAWPNYVLGNHDRARLASRVGSDQARMAAMLLLTLRGTPTLYYGDELGMENGLIPPDKVQDPQGLHLGVERSRDVARTPMQWSPEPQAGFSDVEPWLPVAPDYRERNVQVQANNPDSMLNLYRRLIAYRTSKPALTGGTYRSIGTNADQDCLAFLREHPAGSCLVALNFSSRPQRLALELEGEGEVVLSTQTREKRKISLNSIELLPDEGIIVEVQPGGQKV